MNWATLPYRRYFDFSGRSTEREYWFFMLFVSLVLVVISLLGSFVGDSNLTLTWDSFWVIGGFGFWLFSLLPALAVTIRRYHDQDRSGWFALLVLIPVIGALINFVFMLLPGTVGPNRFGPDPRQTTTIVV